MEGEEASVFPTYKSYVRPEWPYEDWTCIERECERKGSDSTSLEFNDEPNATNIPIKDENGDTTSGCDTTADHHDQNIAASEPKRNVLSTVEFASEHHKSVQGQPVHLDEAQDFMPDHWADDLSIPLDDNAPLCHLLRFMEPQLNVTGIESRKIHEKMNKMMSETSKKLESCYVVFEQCYVIPVGSMAENTKIGKADEFDYAVVLPYFEHFDKLFPIIFQKDESLLYDDPAYVALTNDIASDGNTKEVQENFQSVMKTIWSLYVVDFIPEGWKLSELSCLGEEQSIARTFHLNRLSDGFIVDIDICFWIPIHKSTLEEKGDYFQQKDYLLDNCLDDEMKGVSKTKTSKTKTLRP